MAPHALSSDDGPILAAATDTQLATIRTDRLSINGVANRRSKAKEISGGIAAHTSSDMFKGATHGRPRAKRWDHRLSQESKARKPSSLKYAARFVTKPGMLSLGGGLPSSTYFPIDHVDVQVPAISHFSEEETKALGVIQRVGKHDIAEGKSIYDLHVALNYGQATGSAQMLRFVTEHTELVHDPPYQDWQCCMNAGTTSALEIAFRMFISRGQYVLTEAYAFSSAVETARPMGARWIGVEMDDEGLLPSHLDSILTDWRPEMHDNQPKPFLLYTVPSGHNPTGSTQSLRRRKEVYRVAQKHDLFIVEDEPYYFLQMDDYRGVDAAGPSPPSSHEDFLKSLIPSLLSIDIDGRVLRLDSFAKVIAPGLRVGWVTGSEQIIERFIRHSEVCVQNPGGLSQIVLFKILEETWGHMGYLEWLVYLRLEYTRRRNVIVDACEHYLPKEVASWYPPMAGMFHWIKIDWKKHPLAAQSTPMEIEDEIFLTGIERSVLTCKGSWFRANNDDPGHDVFFRTTFSAAPEEQIREAIKRFGDTLRAVFDLPAQEFPA